MSAPEVLSTGSIVFDDERASDSPFVERVWRCHSERAGTFVSVASSHCEIVVTCFWSMRIWRRKFSAVPETSCTWRGVTET